MLELEVSNFQSIRHATMAVKGFAAIVGRSNIGKSAIVRAAQIALTGATGTEFVRHGQDCDRKVRSTKKCKCASKVVIRTQDLELTWEKGDNISRYTVRRPGEEETVYNNLDRGTPEFLKGGFLPVKIGDRRELIQVPDQFEPIFLLNRTGTVVADVLADVARLDNINKAMAEANKDRKDASAKKKVREEDVADISLSLKQYDGLDAIDTTSLVQVRKDLEGKGRLLKLSDSFIDRTVALKTVMTGLEAALKPQLPDGDILQVRGRQLAQASGFLDDLTAKAPVLRKLMALDQEVVPDAGPLQNLHTKLLRTDAFLHRLTLLETSERSLEGVDSIFVPDGEAIGSMMTNLDKASYWLNRWEIAEADLAKVPTIEDLPEVGTLQTRFAEYARYRQILDDAKTLSESIRSAQDQIKVAEKEEADTLAELEALGVCPTCDQPLGSHHRLHLEAG